MVTVPAGPPDLRFVPAGPPALPFEPTVPALLRHRAEHSAGRECVVTATERIDYAGLERRSARLAGALVAAGVGKGSRVGVLFPNGIDWVLAWAAAARLGAVVLPVNTFYAPPELERFLRHGDVQVLLTCQAFAGHDYLAELETVAPELARADGGRLHLPSLPQLRRVLVWGESPVDWAEGGWQRRADGPEVVPATVVEAMGRDVTPADECTVIYTSGSTGDPKGVVHGHGALVRHAANLAGLSGIVPEDRLWTPMPLCWVGGLCFVLLRAMTVGAAFVAAARFEPGEALALLAAERVTVVAAWPAACTSLVDHPGYAGTDLSAMRAGALYDALPPAARPPSPSLAPGSLGMTETGGPHTFYTEAEAEAGVPEAYRGAFGRPVPGVEHRVVDPDTGVDVAAGEAGEVLVRGYSVMLGLYKRERSEVFDADGWYHTGDRGYFRDGWFFFVERQTEMIKTKGANVSPSEVEHCLLARDDVKLAFVVPVAHPDRGQDVVALVVRWSDAPDMPDPAAAADDMRASLRGKLSSYKVPRHVFLVDDADVPWLASQKADRRALRALAERLTGETTRGSS
jgi:acyl-CoA synthetase (AMP-forming)/AMP-acid ligase II